MPTFKIKLIFSQKLQSKLSQKLPQELKHPKIVLISLLLALTCTHSHAEEHTPTQKGKKTKGFLTFVIENDNFGSGEDKHYTNGVRLSYFNPSFTAPKFTYFLEKIIPGFKINDTTSVYYSLGQNMYTPRDIATTSPDPADRPYAGFLYGAVGLTSSHAEYMDDVELTLGVVGPAALGEEVQTLVHQALNLQEPNGWDSQLKNEPAFLLSWQRQWPEAFARNTAQNTVFRAQPHISLSAGNVYTYAATGLTLQLSPEAQNLETQPSRVRPAIPGSGAFNKAKNTSWKFFTGAEGRLVAHNIFLDGNTFRSGPSVNKKHFVIDLNAGLSFTYKNTQIAYTLNWRSKEFTGQQENSLFGSISIGHRF